MPPIPLLLSLLFSLLLSSLPLSTSANTPAYEATKAYAKKDLTPGRAYGFKEGKSLDGPHIGHTRLVVAWVSGTPGNLDVRAAMFDQVQEAGVSGVRRYFGAKCEANSRPLWNMAPGGTYKFLGEVKFRDFIQGVGNIQDISGQLVEDNNVYNILTNNCNTHVKDLFKQIKARDVLVEIREVLGEEYALVRRDSLLDASDPGLHARSVFDDEMALILGRESVLEMPLQARHMDFESINQRDVEDWMYERRNTGFEDEGLYVKRYLGDELVDDALWERDIYAY